MTQRGTLCPLRSLIWKKQNGCMHREAHHTQTHSDTSEAEKSKTSAALRREEAAGRCHQANTCSAADTSARGSVPALSRSTGSEQSRSFTLTCSGFCTNRVSLNRPEQAAKKRGPGEGPHFLAKRASRLKHLPQQPAGPEEHLCPCRGEPGTCILPSADTLGPGSDRGVSKAW